MSSRSPRGAYKVGPSRAQKPQCGPGEYAWRNFFGSGCKPASQDLRSEARQFSGVRGLRGLTFAGEANVNADGWYNGYNGYDSYDNVGWSSPRSSRSQRSRSPSRRGYGSARRY
jgi:hypothetical protein